MRLHHASMMSAWTFSVSSYCELSQFASARTITMLAALHVLPDDAPAHPLPADADADGSGRSIRFSSAIKIVPSSVAGKGPCQGCRSRTRPDRDGDGLVTTLYYSRLNGCTSIAHAAADEPRSCISHVSCSKDRLVTADATSPLTPIARHIRRPELPKSLIS